ncbi:CAP domain-containing protein [Evansella halocellulosilytica]|uniref:CAP domain-containing protein n=1 Tax=Evansella halocellulosilytica TaxID=2011013 RepID=UPI002A4E24E0|nr:hypothetical protein [Evansella halocellulosilytica]
MKKIYGILCLSCICVFLFGCNGQEDNALEYRNYAEPYPEGGHYSPMDTISSDSTNIQSKEFPHTKARQIQQAKFEFEVDPNQLHPEHLYDLIQDELNIELERRQDGQPQEPAPEQGQPGQPTREPAPEPDQAQPGQPAPEPAPTEPDPAEPEQPEPEQEEQEEPEEDTPQQEDLDGQLNDAERQVIELTNQERRNNGLSDLETHETLSGVAREYRSRPTNS